LQQDRHALPPQVRYLAADGYYSKKKYIDGVVALGLHQIGKLRHDANLRWLYHGEQKSRGRKRIYDGKVKFNDPNRFEVVGETNGVQLYTAVVNSVRLERNLRIVHLGSVDISASPNKEGYKMQEGHKISGGFFVASENTTVVLDLVKKAFN
jgi:hypothetical protein